MTGVGIIGFAGLAAMPQILLGTTAVMTCLSIEFPRSLGLVDYNARDVFVGCRRFFAYCAPEAIGLATVFLVAVLLRLRGDLEVPKDELTHEIWEEIKAEWPVLMGADTLLNLQSMLRLLIFMSAAFRAGFLPGFKRSVSKAVVAPRGTDEMHEGAAAVISPLAGMGAALSLGGMLARVDLCTHAEIYRLEGPLSLGGDLPLFCDLCSVLLLIPLSISALWPRSGAPLRTTVAFALAGWIASRHYLNLARDSSMDSLYTLINVLEFFASLAFLGRAVTSSGSYIQGCQRGRAFVGFVHVLMAFQQALSAYYFQTAFQPSPKLISAGRPFCVLIWSNILAFIAYLCAAVIYLGGLSSEVSEGSDADGTKITDADVGLKVQKAVSTASNPCKITDLKVGLVMPQAVNSAASPSEPVAMTNTVPSIALIHV